MDKLAVYRLMVATLALDVDDERRRWINDGLRLIEEPEVGQTQADTRLVLEALGYVPLS